MRLPRALSRRWLRFEQLEDRLPLSASLGSLDPMAVQTLDAARKPVGSRYPIGLTPNEVRTAYGFDNVSFGGIVGDGTGQTIAIVVAHSSPTIRQDLAVFNQTFGLPDPPSFTIVNQLGGSKLPKKNRGWASEIALDVEWAHAIAPGASILLVEAKNASSFGTAIDFARHVPGVSVISVSAAGDEFKTETQADALFTTPYGHTGETFVFASGDEGGVAEYPSSSPNVLSVGGTSLYLTQSGEWYGETVWSDGGGGASKYEGVPSYQAGLGLTSRGTPDVAYGADPETGFAVFDSYGSGGWAQFGGTSAGTPQWAALLAIANQGRSLRGKDTLANAQSVLYAMPSSDFHDIQYGSNGNYAGTGYDMATGLGSPIADRLIPDLVAYNGSTSFTVTTLVLTKPTKSHKHLQLGAGAVVQLDNERQFDAPASTANRLAKSNKVAGIFLATPARASSNFALQSALLPFGSSSQVESTDDANAVLRRRFDSEASPARAPFRGDDSVAPSVDAYFATVGAAA